MRNGLPTSNYTMNLDLSLYLVTDANCAGRSLLHTVENALRGGVTFLQYREKNVASPTYRTDARRLQQLARQYAVPFVVNDDVDLAMELQADGIHVGQHDAAAGAVRRLIGPGKILGVSVSNVEEARQAERDDADYVGVGAFFTTPTKTDADRVTLQTLRDICLAIRLPVVGIGGITPENSRDILACGAKGVAIVSAILQAPNPEHAARRFPRYGNPIG